MRDSSGGSEPPFPNLFWDCLRGELPVHMGCAGVRQEARDWVPGNAQPGRAVLCGNAVAQAKARSKG